MTKLTGPISRKDAEVIALALESAAMECINEHLLIDLAAAVLAAAREPLGEAWAIVDSHGDMVDVGLEVILKSYATLLKQLDYRAVRVAITPLDNSA